MQIVAASLQPLGLPLVIELAAARSVLIGRGTACCWPSGSMHANNWKRTAKAIACDRACCGARQLAGYLIAALAN